MTNMGIQKVTTAWSSASNVEFTPMHILLWLTVSVLVLAAGYAVFVAVFIGNLDN